MEDITAKRPGAGPTGSFENNCARTASSCWRTLPIPWTTCISWGERTVPRPGGALTGRRLSDLDRERYILLLDHQPYDFDGEAEAGADLVLCGHTHGGQFIPIRRVGVWIGENCRTYGHERRLRTDFIVSSGIGNWAFRFKTGCFSEYVIVDVHGR